MFRMMDRPSTSTNPLFIEQDDDMSTYVTKSHLFGAQRALHQEQQAMSKHIDNLATDLRLSGQRTRDYFNKKLDDHKQENDARMVEIRALLLNRSSSTSSSSRRSCSSRHSDYTISGSSTLTSNTLRHAAHQDRQANHNPLHDNSSQEQRHRQNQATFVQARERQRQRQQKRKSERVYTKMHKMPRHNVKNNNCEKLKHLRRNKPSEIQVEP
ncbi:hypothetical protein VPH35_001661 [Triticum aestivum]